MKKIYVALFAILGVVFSAALVASSTITQHHVSAASCGSEPSSTTGRISQTVTVPQTGMYTIWSRLKAPSTSAVQYSAYVNGQCLTIGGSSLSAGAWTWVNYQDGTPGSTATVSLNSGSQPLVLTAGSDGLQVDRVMLISDSCTPTGTGTNCENDTTPPAGSILSPTNGSTVSGMATISASANDNDKVDHVEFYVDGSLKGSDSTSPYSYSWDTTAISDGAHVLTIKVYDASGLSYTSSATNVTVHNAPTPVNAHISSFTASPSTITTGDTSTLSWVATVGANCQIDTSVGAVSLSASRSVSPTTTTTYTLHCDGIDGGLGASMSAKVTVNPAAPIDTDGDGIPDVVESAGPNSGDANGDGTADAQQADVVSFPNVKTGGYSTLTINSTCTKLSGVQSLTSNRSKSVMGNFAFTIQCPSNGLTANVVLLLDKNYDTSHWRYFKYSSAGVATDITSTVTVSSQTVNGGERTKLAYTVTDGDVLDDDGMADGTIIDPFGIETTDTPATSSPAVQNGGILASTGANRTLFAITAGCMIALGGLLLVARQKHRMAARTR